MRIRPAPTTFMPPRFRLLTAEDLRMLHEWLQRPHFQQWWKEPTTIAELEHDYVQPRESSTMARRYSCAPSGRTMIPSAKKRPDPSLNQKPARRSPVVLLR